MWTDLAVPSAMPILTHSAVAKRPLEHAWQSAGAPTSAFLLKIGSRTRADRYGFRTRM